MDPPTGCRADSAGAAQVCQRRSQTSSGRGLSGQNHGGPVRTGDRRRPGPQLSGGEQQRVSIARALAKNPKLLLCDEPTGALDSRTSRSILTLLETINNKYGTTMMIVTHNNAIRKMVDRVIIIKDGEISECSQNAVRVPAAELTDL